MSLSGMLIFDAARLRSDYTVFAVITLWTASVFLSVILDLPPPSSGLSLSPSEPLESRSLLFSLESPMPLRKALPYENEELGGLPPWIEWFRGY